MRAPVFESECLEFCVLVLNQLLDQSTRIALAVLHARLVTCVCCHIKSAVVTGSVSQDCSTCCAAQLHVLYTSPAGASVQILCPSMGEGSHTRCWEGVFRWFAYMHVLCLVVLLFTSSLQCSVVRLIFFADAGRQQLQMFLS